MARTQVGQFLTPSVLPHALTTWLALSSLRAVAGLRLSKFAMGRYALIFRGGATPETIEEGAEVAAACASWMNGLGDALIDMGNAFGQLTTIESDGSTIQEAGPKALSGYTLICADSHEPAVAMASGCPILRYGGSIEVAELAAL